MGRTGTIATATALGLCLAGQAAAQQAAIDAPAGTLPREQAAAAPSKPDTFPGDVSGSVTVTTDYVFRGISQSDENPAIQGSLDWTHDSGLFLGVWGSSVDFNDNDQASAELDWYAGYGGEYRRLGYDARVIYYSYPGADTARDYDYWEAAISMTAKPLSNLELTAGYNFSPDFFNESGTAHYLHGEGVYSLGGMRIPVNVLGGVGYQWINNNGAFGTPDYFHWSAGLGTTVEKVDLTLTYSDTNLSDRECGGGLDTCDARVMFSAGYTM